jgi:uncharacterized protein (DUF1330 family)
MPAYVVLIREGEVIDEAALRSYRKVPDQAAARPPDMTALAYYGAIEALEGKTPEGVVIFEFPTVEAARAWYFSPQYQARVPLRRKAAPYRGFIVEGLAQQGESA